MAQARLELLFLAKNLAAGAVNSLNSQLGGLGATGKSFSGMAKGGFGLGLGLGTFSLATGLISEVGNAIGGMVKNAQEDEQSVARLTTSLKANTVGWQQHAMEIEHTIRANQQLAFSDDETRNSLSLLVAATHDVTAAIKVQRTAMDLARFKGISLEEATLALTRVEGGQFRALKALGIVLEDGATATDALAAVQKVASDQAEAYGKTTAGATDRLSDSFAELGEQVGKLTSGPLSFLADSLSNMIHMNTDFKALVIDPWTEGLVHVGASADLGAAGLRDLGRESRHAGEGLWYAKGKADLLVPSLKDVEGAADSAANAVAEAIFGPGIAKAHRVSLKLELKDATEHLAKLQGIKHPTRAQREDMAQTQEQVGHLNEDLVTTDAKLAALGYKPASDELGAWLLKTGGQVSALDRDAIMALGHLAALTGIDPGRNVYASDEYIGDRASGGPVMPGGSYTVGENGPERLLMGSRGGYVLPNRGGSSSGGQLPPVIVQVDGRELFRFFDRNSHYGVGLAATTGLRT
jgi:hypothetical protein